MDENDFDALFKDFIASVNFDENKISDKLEFLKIIKGYHSSLEQSLKKSNQQDLNDLIGSSLTSLAPEMLKFLEDKMLKLIPKIFQNNKKYNLEELSEYREILIKLQPKYPKNIELSNQIEEINTIIGEKYLQGNLQGAQNPLYTTNGTIPGDQVGTMRQVETIKQPSSGKRYRLEGYDNTEKAITLRKDDPLAHVQPSREVLGEGNVLGLVSGFLTKQEIGRTNQLKKTYAQRIESKNKEKGTEESKDKTPSR
ncbi:hypothetical protein phytr_4600 [Candidatus Phycorickettsia trachydisci]|uniref:Uncharacterized protein n=1 Tax=Candidatus Phycorickettsia trachydisci TaxID=2115978 RepID=A0A2P1P804_9RICK|nr:hypothetical protein [Candidatus Phycorickettsia trachydisci]AVP87410.1 hypothetical protein phytr_4600 [Candidatus Phycorickettsia trachydisci]